MINNRINFAFLVLLLASAVVCAMTGAMGPDGVNAYAVHAAGITGAGVNIAVLSTGNVRSRHTAFERPDGSAVSLYDFSGAGLKWSNHDTHIAGILISAGTPSHPDQIGVAPGAHVHSGRISGAQLQARYLKNALDTLIREHNCRVIVTGIQLASPTVRADGGSYWTELYDYYAETYDVIFANAAGNNMSHVTIFGDAYNGITTAGLIKDEHGVYRRVGRKSNSGPTLDARHKPDVAAPTQSLYVPASAGDDAWTVVDPNSRGLTSYAIPFTAGAAALLLEAAAKTPVADDDHSEVIKAILINSTDTDMIDKNGSEHDAVSAWNSDFGYGRLDALRAYRTLEGGRVSVDKPTEQPAGWAYAVMDGNDEHVYRISGQAGQRLVTTVAWNRKLLKISPASFINARPFSVRLKIVSPAGRSVVFEIPDKNNLIKADYLLDETGPYQIVLQNPTFTSGRDYGMAFECLTNTAETSGKTP